GDDFDYSANLTFDGQSMVVTNTNTAFSTNYILTVAGEEGNDAAMLRLKGAGNRSAYIGLGASDHMIFKNNHATSATAGFVFFNRLGASLASFTNTVAHLPFGVIVNEAGGDFDVRIEGDGDANLFFTDAGNDRVGIGTNSPSEKLEVNGTFKASNVLSGTYTPTLTDSANVTSSTAYACQYMRVGNVVTVSGKVDVTATSDGNTETLLAISLPVASAFSQPYQAAGTAAVSWSDTMYNWAASIQADVDNDRLLLRFPAEVDSEIITLHFTVTYQIL